MTTCTCAVQASWVPLNGFSLMRAALSNFSLIWNPLYLSVLLSLWTASSSSAHSLPWENTVDRSSAPRQQTDSYSPNRKAEVWLDTENLYLTDTCRGQGQPENRRGNSRVLPWLSEEKFLVSLSPFFHLSRNKAKVKTTLPCYLKAFRE